MLDAEAEEKSRARSGPCRKLRWKTEWLVCNFYVRCNISMRRTGALFGITATLVHDIVYAWANLLCDALEQIFPIRLRSKMLQAYPVSHIKKFGGTCPNLHVP